MLLVPLALAGDLDTLTDTLLPRVEAIHGFSFLTPPRRQTMSPEELARWLSARLDEDAEEFPIAEAVYRRLGLLGPEDSLRALTERIMGEQVAGLYNPRDKVLYVVDSRDAGVDEARQLFLAHEIAHALDDQRFNLGALLELDGNSDALSARQAVVEGSATILMTRYMAQGVAQHWIDPRAMLAYSREERGKTEALEAYPPVLPTTLIAPYLAGFGFLAWGKEASELGGACPWFGERLTEALATATSMEQVLHPERYWESKDEPVLFDTPALPWAIRDSDSLGELLVAQVLDPERRIGLTAMGLSLPDGKKLTSRAATGWDGDRYYLLEDGRGLWVSAWDSEKDRKEFTRALHKVLPEATFQLVGALEVRVGLGLSDAELAQVGPIGATEGGASWSAEGP